MASFICSEDHTLILFGTKTNIIKPKNAILSQSDVKKQAQIVFQLFQKDKVNRITSLNIKYLTNDSDNNNR